MIAWDYTNAWNNLVLQYRAIVINLIAMIFFRFLTRISFLQLTIAIILLATLTSVAQNNVEGVIKDENGKPVAGTNILIMGTPEGTVSDSLGRFELTLPPGNIGC